METSGNSPRCNKCGTQLVEHAPYCHGCGTVIAPVDECPKCHAKLVEGSEFCHKCGSAIAKETRPRRITAADLLPKEHDDEVFGDSFAELRDRSVDEPEQGQRSEDTARTEAKPREFFNDDEVRRLVDSELIPKSDLDEHLRGEKGISAVAPSRPGDRSAHRF